MIRWEALIELESLHSSFSSSNFSIRAFRLDKQFPVEQFEASRAIRGSSISVSSTLPPSKPMGIARACVRPLARQTVCGSLLRWLARALVAGFRVHLSAGLLGVHFRRRHAAMFANMPTNVFFRLRLAMLLLHQLSTFLFDRPLLDSDFFRHRLSGYFDPLGTRVFLLPAVVGSMVICSSETYVQSTY